MNQSSDQAMVASKARKFDGLNVVRDPYIDGVLYLDQKDGLRFVDASGQTIFKYLPQDVQRLTFGVTRLSVKPRSGKKFAISLDATATLQEVRDEKTAGVAGIVDSVSEPVGEVATTAIQASHLASINKLGKVADRDAWAKQLKSLSYPITDLSFKKQMVLGLLGALVVVVAIFVVVLTINS